MIPDYIVIPDIVSSVIIISVTYCRIEDGPECAIPTRALGQVRILFADRVDYAVCAVGFIVRPRRPEQRIGQLSLHAVAKLHAPQTVHVDGAIVGTAQPAQEPA